MSRHDKMAAMGHKGATSERARRTRQYPLRKIVSESEAGQVLECGHTLPWPSGPMARAAMLRRRCSKCFAQDHAQITD